MTFERRTPEEIVVLRRQPVPEEIVSQARAIVDRVLSDGEPALRALVSEFDGSPPDAPLYLSRRDLIDSLADAPAEDRARLERIAKRIRRFARAQRGSLQNLTTATAGGLAGHDLMAIEHVGCYAPGGRYPLPSSVLMTVIPARVAGSSSIWVASPNPAPVTVWAAAVAGADGLLAGGGAHAVAALAAGLGPMPASDIVVGPGNLWVTAAKQLLAGRIGIDLPAGPSELVVIADDTSDPGTVAADLLAQAEHDTEARAVLLTCSGNLARAVADEVERQLRELPTAATARQALAGGGWVLCTDDDDLVRLANALAPEHLQLSVARPERFRGRLEHCGALFIGNAAAEVFGDYGAGPNHVLPTGGAARYTAGLSVMTFLRVRTWMAGNDNGIIPEIVDDTVWLARQEGLEAHARAAERRRGRPPS